MLKILDVSHYNTVTDWAKVKNAVDGVMLRVGYRGYSSGKIAMDNKFREYATACKKVGLPFGVYFMSQAITDAEGEAEAILKIQQATAEGIRMINEASPSQAVLTIKSFEALEKVANGQATKIIIPSEIQNVGALVASIKEVATDVPTEKAPVAPAPK